MQRAREDLARRLEVVLEDSRVVPSAAGDLSGSASQRETKGSVREESSAVAREGDREEVALRSGIRCHGLCRNTFALIFSRRVPQEHPPVVPTACKPPTSFCGANRECVDATVMRSVCCLPSELCLPKRSREVASECLRRAGRVGEREIDRQSPFPGRGSHPVDFWNTLQPS